MPPAKAQDDTSPEPVYSQAELTAIIRQALAQQHDEHEAQMRGLSDQIAGLQSSISGTVPALTPEHAGGPGNERADTWSQWEQTLSWRDREDASA